MADITPEWAMVILTFISICAFFWLQSRQTSILNKQTEIAHKQLVITEYQEKERQMGKSYANLTAQIVHRPEEKHFRDFLRIENKGPADARDITISVDSDLEILDLPKEISHMSVDSSLQYPIIRTAAAGLSGELKLDIHWSDDSGEPRQKQMSLNV